MATDPKSLRSQYLGILVGQTTGKPYGLINPDSDAELDDPQLLRLGTENGEKVRLIRVARQDIGSQLTLRQIKAIMSAYAAT